MRQDNFTWVVASFGFLFFNLKDGVNKYNLMRVCSVVTTLKLQTFHTKKRILKHL